MPHLGIGKYKPLFKIQTPIENLYGSDYIKTKAFCSTKALRDNVDRQLGATQEKGGGRGACLRYHLAIFTGCEDPSRWPSSSVPFTDRCANID